METYSPPTPPYARARTLEQALSLFHTLHTRCPSHLHTAPSLPPPRNVALPNSDECGISAGEEVSWL